MSGRIVPVVLCGGAGTRLWPASTDVRPKPFLRLADGRSLIEATLGRVDEPDAFAPPVIVAAARHGRLFADLLAGAGEGAALVLEPEARNTAAAVAAGAGFVARTAPDAVLLVLAADHLIRDAAGFRATVAAARGAAEAGRLVVFGIPPAGPATGYGYIRPGAAIPGEPGVFRVDAFVEKPDAARAAAHVADGYLWNSGNFMLRAGVALAEIGRWAPEVGEAVAGALAGAAPAGGGLLLAAGPLAAAPRISFDRAVMERTAEAAVVAAGFDWSDVGTWASVWEAAETDAAGNAAAGRVALFDTRGSYVASDGPAVGVVGLDDVVVVADSGGVLVAARGRSEDVKLVPGLLAPEAGGRVLTRGEDHAVERFALDPGDRLQVPGDRPDTRWIVASGMVEMTVAGTIERLGPGDAAAVPMAAACAFVNPAASPAVLVAVSVRSPR